MSINIVNILVLMITIGICLQWFAWRFRFPVVVLLIFAGILIGPVFGWIQPSRDFPHFLKPFVHMSVGILLFHASLNLKFTELKGLGHAVRRLVTLGVLVSGTLGTLAAYYTLDLGWSEAAILGSILVVTGPTVITPLLRHAKLKSRVASILKWEGILNDPIGALLSVLVFEYVIYQGSGIPWIEMLKNLLAAAVGSLILALIGSGLIYQSFRRGKIPEYLKVPVVLTVWALVFQLSHLIQNEAGLLGSTFLGIIVGNMKLPVAEDLRRFKETISVFLVSLVFLFLTADLRFSEFSNVGVGYLAFLFLTLFCTRPLSVFFSTLNTNLKWTERVLLGWIAPRGIVAASMAGLFGLRLAETGNEQGSLLASVVFGVVFVTATAHGLTLGWFGRKLGLAAGNAHGVILVGITPWSLSFANTLHNLGIQVLLVDRENNRIQSNKYASLQTYIGDILSESHLRNVDVVNFQNVIACTNNDSYNALICTLFADIYGRQHTFQLAPAAKIDKSGRKAQDWLPALTGRVMGSEEISFEELLRRHFQDWQFKLIPVQDETKIPVLEDTNAIKFLRIRGEQEIEFFTQDHLPSMKAGDKLLVYQRS